MRPKEIFHALRWLPKSTEKFFSLEELASGFINIDKETEELLFYKSFYPSYYFLLCTYGSWQNRLRKYTQCYQFSTEVFSSVAFESHPKKKLSAPLTAD